MNPSDSFTSAVLAIKDLGDLCFKEDDNLLSPFPLTDEGISLKQPSATLSQTLDPFMKNTALFCENFEGWFNAKTEMDFSDFYKLFLEMCVQTLTIFRIRHGLDGKTVEYRCHLSRKTKRNSKLFNSKNRCNFNIKCIHITNSSRILILRAVLTHNHASCDPKLFFEFFFKKHVGKVLAGPIKEDIYKQLETPVQLTTTLQKKNKAHDKYWFLYTHNLKPASIRERLREKFQKEKEHSNSTCLIFKSLQQQQEEGLLFYAVDDESYSHKNTFFDLKKFENPEYLLAEALQSRLLKKKLDNLVNKLKKEVIHELSLSMTNPICALNPLVICT
mmetsp:Transcript_41135/g.47764  ORF Transcript_41135/g.47764 Transcript_41135/m.47764 type:complete len:331 (+) Transcript_41135:822-1814(+)|eukprot:CAMPEP_0176420596 /NCGR_PEP_ID=MMETSP0127-20121128/8696_1 /TAXON_ID=938130 /ORGANISM="Platyophrya macrostoma, Strain WH" /LENGTH=330 /DNA_ID=CAMNT_0017801213 /DNA_START=818 /DNA_END=1810 /DNA_ORIENTATION=+